MEDKLKKEAFLTVDLKEVDSIAQDIVSRKKDAVLNIRMNSRDLRSIKQKARKMGVKYQTFISELLHRIAHS